jgi:DNA-directed RNA polymerase specialized sigma24 family protein
MADFASETAPWLASCGRFETTHWSIVLCAGRQGPERARALDRLCRIYWYPIYAFIRRRGHGVDDAHDLTQDFFARLLAGDWLDGVEQRNTRFSTLLLTMLKRFLVNEYEHSHAARRGGGKTPVPIDAARAEEWFGAEPAITVTPEKLFERSWAVSVLEAALERLRAEATAAGKARHFETLSPFLSREPAPGDYELAGAALELEASAVAVAVHRLRHHYRDFLRRELAGDQPGQAPVEDELRHLFLALTGQ